jgi:BMFP domain-containing protein YqiC
MYRLFSKQNLRSKDVHLQGVLWETTDFICSSSSCGRVTNGYGNYVSKLKERVDELEAQISALNAYATAANPMTEEGDRVLIAENRLRAAYCIQQPLPVPDQMALVFRADIMRAAHAAVQVKAHRDSLKKRLAELEKQLAPLLPAVTVPPMLEGTWLITQGNGRQYTVHSSAKASIARKCGYTVEEIRRDADSAPGQSNQCINTGNQA